MKTTIINGQEVPVIEPAKVTTTITIKKQVRYMPLKMTGNLKISLKVTYEEMSM